MRALAALSVTALSLSAAALPGAVQHPSSVTALVTVFPDTPEPLRSLTAGDFIVREDGAAREVTGAGLAADSLFVSLLVDTTQPPVGTQAPVQDMRAALSAFVRILRTHGSLGGIALGEFAGASVPVVPFGKPAASMDAAISRLYPNRPSDGVLLEALVDAAQALGAQPPPRRAIVSLDLHSVESSQDRMMERATQAVQKTGAMYFAISVRGLGAPASNPRHGTSFSRDAVLDALTAASGGLRLTAALPSGLEALLAQVAAGLVSQYEVTLARPPGRPLKPLRMECRCAGRVLVSSMIR